MFTLIFSLSVGSSEITIHVQEMKIVRFVEHQIVHLDEDEQGERIPTILTQ